MNIELLIDSLTRYWPYGLAAIAGIVFAMIDRRIFGRPVLAIALILLAVACAIGMKTNPFTFASGDSYVMSLIGLSCALSALAGYAVSYIVQLASKGKAS